MQFHVIVLFSLPAKAKPAHTNQKMNSPFASLSISLGIFPTLLMSTSQTYVAPVVRPMLLMSQTSSSAAVVVFQIVSLLSQVLLNQVRRLFLILSGPCMVLTLVVDQTMTVVMSTTTSFELVFTRMTTSSSTKTWSQTTLVNISY